MTPRWKWTLAAASGAAVLGGLALLPSGRGAPEASNLPAGSESAHAPVQAVLPPSAATQPVAPVAVPASAGSADLRASTQRALASDNAGDRIEALRAVRDRHAVELLPDVLALDPAADPDLAPTLISVATDLANQADATAQSQAAARLATWLRSESQRATSDARGNQSLLVESLGKLKTPESVRALSEAIASDQLPVHVGTLAADGLANVGNPSARPAVERFRARVAEHPAADSFSQELRSEALASADRALAAWR